MKLMSPVKVPSLSLSKSSILLKGPRSPGWFRFRFHRSESCPSLSCRNLHLVFAAQELYRSVAIYLCIEGVGDALLLHDVDIVGYHAHSYRLTYLEMLVVLDEKFVALLGFCQHLVVYSLEDGRGYLAHKLGVGGIGGNFDVFRTYHDIHFLVAAEALVYTRQFGPATFTRQSWTIVPQRILLSPIKSATKALAGSL